MNIKQNASQRFKETGTKRPRLFRLKLSSLFRRMKGLEKTNQGMMEMATADFVHEISGPNGLLDQRLHEMLREFDAATMPLGKQEAENILNELLNIAQGQRSVLTERVAMAAEDGSMLAPFQKRMNKVNDLAAQTYIALIRMQSLREEYEYQRSISDAVVATSNNVKSINLDARERERRIKASQGEPFSKIDDEIT